MKNTQIWPKRRMDSCDGNCRVYNIALHYSYFFRIASNPFRDSSVTYTAVKYSMTRDRLLFFWRIHIL